MPLNAGPVYVLFPARPQDGRPEWWHRMLSPGWRHVFAAQSCLPANTLVLSHEGRHLRIGVAEEPIGAFIDRIAPDCRARVLSLLPPPHAPRSMLRPPMTCVESVKAWLGIAAPFVLTPRQLFHHLLAQGAGLIADHATSPEEA
jgi:hypothetical protein